MDGLIGHQVLIDGNWTDADSGASLAVLNPADLNEIATVPNCGRAETKRAIDAAARAFPKWRALTAKQRSKLLHAWSEAILENSEQLASLMTAEQGKPLRESRAEVEYGASFIEWYAEESKRILGEVIPPVDSKKKILVFKEPVGVCAAITPWNFPIAMVTRKLGPALAAGCTVVLKPAEQTPLCALALGKLACEVGIPAGVLNIITGEPEAIGAELTSNPTVRKLSFTGSTEVGRLLMSQCSGTLKRMSLELGGNAPFIVFADANLEEAVSGAIASKFRNSGQTCVCANRILVEKGIAERFSELLCQAVSKLRVGSGNGEGVDIGPLIDEAAVTKVETLLADAVQHGAKIRLGGKKLSGLFFEPTVVEGVTGAMRLCHEEIFGPVAPVMTFENEAEAIRIANSSEYGLAAYCYTSDLSRSFRMMENLEAGIVSLNSGIFSTEVAPFGGVKQSGFGREGSAHGIDEFVQLKYCCVGINS